jgi:hypothetical protein
VAPVACLGGPGCLSGWPRLLANRGGAAARGGEASADLPSLRDTGCKQPVIPVKAISATREWGGWKPGGRSFMKAGKPCSWPFGLMGMLGLVVAVE